MKKGKTKNERERAERMRERERMNERDMPTRNRSVGTVLLRFDRLGGNRSNGRTNGRKIDGWM